VPYLECTILLNTPDSADVTHSLFPKGHLGRHGCVDGRVVFLALARPADPHRACLLHRTTRLRHFASQTNPSYLLSLIPRFSHLHISCYELVKLFAHFSFSGAHSRRIALVSSRNRRPSHLSSLETQSSSCRRLRRYSTYRSSPQVRKLLSRS
jgi:hypothetical protein